MIGTSDRGFQPKNLLFFSSISSKELHGKQNELNASAILFIRTECKVRHAVLVITLLQNPIAPKTTRR